MTPTERQRIERDAEKLYPHHLDGNYRFAYIAGATAEHDKARNQAIDDVIKRLSIMVHYGNIDLSWSFIKEEIEQLKTKP